MAYQRVAKEDEVWPGEMRGAVAGAKRILIVRSSEGVSAFEDRCAHLGVALSERGALAGSVLKCGVHGWEYDAATGRGINPASACLRRLAAKIEGAEIWVDPEATI